MSLGSLLGFLRLSWEALRVKNADSPTRKLPFCKCSFLALCSLNGSLGLILVRLGWIWFQNGFPKVFEKVIKSLSKNDRKKEAYRVSKRVPKNMKNEIAGLRHFLPSMSF